MSNSIPRPAGSLQLNDVHEAEQREYAAAAVGLARQLELAGFRIDRLRELRHREVGDRHALPILLTWLSRELPAPLKGDIAYVLGSRWAQPEGGRALLAEYHRIDALTDGAAARVRAALCTSLERVADDTMFDDLVEIARDPTHRSERGMAIVALGNMRDARTGAVDELVALLADDEAALFALLGLLKLDAREAIRQVAFATRHRNPVVRQVALRIVHRWAAAGEGQVRSS
jgi:hypothetical protein